MSVLASKQKNPPSEDIVREDVQDDLSTVIPQRPSLLSKPTDIIALCALAA